MYRLGKLRESLLWVVGHVLWIRVMRRHTCIASLRCMHGAVSPKAIFHPISHRRTSFLAALKPNSLAWSGSRTKCHCKPNTLQK